MIFPALKPVILRDSDSFRQKIFAELRQRSRMVRVVENIYLHSPLSIRGLLLLAYGVKSYLEAPALTNRVSCVYSYENERKRFKYLRDLLDNLSLDLCKIERGPQMADRILNLINHLSDLPRLFRILKYISGRFDFLVSCRLSSTLFYYFWFNFNANYSKFICWW